MSAVGRPVEWTEERIADAKRRILQGVASGMSVTRCLKELDDMPASSRFWADWHISSEEFQTELARAREAGVEVKLEEAVDIAEDGSNDWMEKHDKDGNFVGWQLNGEHVQRSKLRIDTRIKYAQMIAPRKYGPKLDLTSKGDRITPDMDAVTARAAALMARAKVRKDEAK